MISTDNGVKVTVLSYKKIGILSFGNTGRKNSATRAKMTLISFYKEKGHFLPAPLSILLHQTVYRFSSYDKQHANTQFLD